MTLYTQRPHQPGLRAPGAWALALLVSLGAAVTGTAATAGTLTAHPAVRYDPKERCPELRVADEGDIAVTVFMVNAYGTPSRASVRSPSGVAGLDAAALACVMKLKFQPATSPGDAQPVESWQQLGLRYASPARTNAVSAPAVAGPPVAATAAVAGAAAAAAGTPAGNRVTAVHVCVDAAGALTQDPHVTRSSGDVALDAAAVKAARLGSAYYHPAGVQGLSGCAEVSITFEGR
jgi:TonB family protein